MAAAVSAHDTAYDPPEHVVPVLADMTEVTAAVETTDGATNGVVDIAADGYSISHVVRMAAAVSAHDTAYDPPKHAVPVLADLTEGNAGGGVFRAPPPLLPLDNIPSWSIDMMKDASTTIFGIPEPRIFQYEGAHHCSFNDDTVLAFSRPTAEGKTLIPQLTGFFRRAVCIYAEPLLGWPPIRSTALLPRSTILRVIMATSTSTLIKS